MSPREKERSVDSNHTSEIKQATRSDDAAGESTTKRRTKTGCLTCRKRRIKCGEERPICKNCIKSRRECAGYNQPLLFQQYSQNASDSNLVPDSYGSFVWNPGLDQYDNASNIFSNVPPANPPQSTSKRDNIHWEGYGYVSTPWQNQINTVEPGSHCIDPGSYYGTTTQRNSGLSEPREYHQQSSRMAHVPRTWNGSSTGAPTLDSSHIDSRELSTHPAGAMFGRSDIVAAMPHLPSTQNDFLHRHEVESNITAANAYDMKGLPSARGFTDGVSAAAFAPLGYQPGMTNISKTQLLTPLYQPPYVTTLLNDEKAQYIFRHFIHVTGASMGTFEDHVYRGVSGLQKTLWTHSLPTMALNHPALAHAILAVAAIHMSKLNLGSTDTAVKHFTYACRRVGKVLGDSKLRLEVSTLATVMLLGYYEVMAGDHSRWTLHLNGASKLVMEHDYAGLIRTIRHLRAKAGSTSSQPWTSGRDMSYEEYIHISGVSPNVLYSDHWAVDQKLISQLMGHEINYDVQVQPNFRNEFVLSDLDEKGIDNWKILMELYWWYCKQDVFQSMLSGETLILPYTQWKYCPPRGPINDAERPNASMDHLWLLLARLSDFGAKDRKRKQQVVKAQGGRWIPPPGFFIPGPSQNIATTSPKTAHSGSPASITTDETASTTKKRTTHVSPSPPAFYGMMPTYSSHVYMPPSFEFMNSRLQHHSFPNTGNQETLKALDLEVQTRYALIEHKSITDAFDLFEPLLGPEFGPLRSDDIQISTPFGPALRYKSPAIAAMWAMYYVGRIVLRRVHPGSPPAAMVSAGVNAPFTRDDAQMIGRICGGLFAQHSYLRQAGHTDHFLTSAVIETTFSLLFAGIQFQDPAQRDWTITKLDDVAHVLGWRSSDAIAAACETTWETMGLKGKGPPYKRTRDKNHEDERVSGKYSHSYDHPPTTAGADGSKNKGDPQIVSHDRTRIGTDAKERVHWALGLLSVERDIERMRIHQDE